MSSEYRRNHYVTQWYQRRFIPPEKTNRELFYRDLDPPVIPNSGGRTRNAVRPLGPKMCFVEDDLYTTRFGNQLSTDIERFFFGAIDTKGRQAVEYFEQFDHTNINPDAFKDLLLFMSTQKARTPKGLACLAKEVGSTEPNRVLTFMLKWRQRYCAIWSECVWQIADASQSVTKFIVSDHPVTVYNRRCSPRSVWCRDGDDPDIRFHATHTLFPLSMDKILILTNRSWVMNPYQSEVDRRPNPTFFREAMFSFLDVQILRHLSEQEVLQINFIIRSRALRYVAAAKEEWLYPENHVSQSDWNDFGDGYLLMPDPRSIYPSSGVTFGFADGSSTAFDSYGRRPWQPGFRNDFDSGSDHESLLRFQGEFARLYGPYRRGRAMAGGKLDSERDSEDFHQYHLGLERKVRSG